jgi:hypothetical protein
MYTSPEFDLRSWRIPPVTSELSGWLGILQVPVVTTVTKATIVYKVTMVTKTTMATQVAHYCCLISAKIGMCRQMLIKFQLNENPFSVFVALHSDRQT